METETSRLTRTPVEATEIPVKLDELYPYKRNIQVQRDIDRSQIDRTRYFEWPLSDISKSIRK